MYMFKTTWVWILIAVLVLGGWSMGQYNGFVTANTGIDGQWAEVENQFQRRYDLIPNLTASVKGLMTQEKAVFTALAEARTRYGTAVEQSGSVDEKIEAANGLASALRGLLVVVEKYPELRSSESVSKLMDELAGTENRIGVARQRFNTAVTEYNASVRVFPGNMFAKLFGFNARPLFEAEAGSEKVPAVTL